MKSCPKCGNTKPLDSFSFKNKAKGTRSSECKDCHREYRDTYYAENKQREIQRVADRRRRLTEELKALKEALRCSRCPEDHIACLHFHHLDPHTKEVNISLAISKKGWSMSRLKEEIAKCEVVCGNCHAKIHYAGMM